MLRSAALRAVCLVLVLVACTVAVQARPSSQHQHHRQPHVHTPSHHTPSHSHAIIISDADTVPGDDRDDGVNLFPDVAQRLDEWKSIKQQELLASPPADSALSATPVKWSYGENSYTITGRPEGTRSWYLYIPESYQASQSVSLVLALHGLGDTAQSFTHDVNLTNIAEAEGFILVYPQGSTGLLGTGWNAGTCCVSETVDDLGFISGIVAQVNATFSIRQDSVHSMGFSNGGFMTESIGCHFSHLFTSTASVSGDTILVWGGQQALAACDALFTSPLSFLHIHGTGDLTVPIGGEPLLGWPSIKDDLTAWSKRNGCPSAPIQTLNISTFTNFVYQGCESQPGGIGEVQLVLNAGGGHIWPMVPDVFVTSQYILDFWNRVTPGGIAPVPLRDE
jgi:polyhydroxybutyrate depolymerase